VLRPGTVCVAKNVPRSHIRNQEPILVDKRILALGLAQPLERGKVSKQR
jgi:hypothetical protein